MNIDGLQPVIKHVRPYKTLLLTLPPKSFGFWVLGNTNVEACQEHENSETDNNIQSKATHVSDTDEQDQIETQQIKKRNERSAIFDEPRDFLDFTDYSDDYLRLDRREDISAPKLFENNISYDSKEELSNLVDNINKDLKFILTDFNQKKRTKREIKNQIKSNNDLDLGQKGFKEHSLGKNKETLLKSQNNLLNIRSNLLEKLLESRLKFNNTRTQIMNRLKKRANSLRSKVLKRSAVKKIKIKPIHETSKTEKLNNIRNEHANRTRRNVIYTYEDDSDNEIDNENDYKLNKIIKKLRKSNKNLPLDIEFETDVVDNTGTIKKTSKETDTIEEKIVLKTFLSGDKAKISINEKLNSNGLLSSLVDGVNSILDDLKQKSERILFSLMTLEHLPDRLSDE